MDKKCSTDISVWMLLVSVTANPIQTRVLRLEPRPSGATKPGTFCLLLCLLLCRTSLMVSKFFLQLCGYIISLSHSAKFSKFWDLLQLDQVICVPWTNCIGQTLKCTSRVYPRSCDICLNTGMELASLRLLGCPSSKWEFWRMKNITLIHMQQQKLFSSLEENAKRDKKYKFVKW